MPQFMVAVYLPDDYDPSIETEATIEAIHALNRELIAAGVRKFACGISPAANAKSLRAQPDGTLLITDGPFIETKEQLGGFLFLEVSDLDEALEWADRLPWKSNGCFTEIRPIMDYSEWDAPAEWGERAAS